jgi:DNA polymerase I-like protein with 3'-5' exonuclease and polymerase domains
MHPLHTDNVSGKTYIKGRWLAFDVETTNLEFGDARNAGNRVVCVSWQEGKGNSFGKIRSIYGPLGDAKEFWAALERADFLVAHNAKFEAHWLWRHGYDPTDRFWYDTMLGEWVLLGNNPDKLLFELGAVAERYNEDGKDERLAGLMDSGVCPSEWPKDDLLARCEGDVRATSRVARKQIGRLKRKGTLPVAAQRCLTMAVLCATERTGLELDRDRVKETYEEYYAAHQELLARFTKLSGGVNPNSPSQLAHYLYGGGMIEEKYKLEIGTYKNGNTRYKTETRVVPNPAKSLRFAERKDRRGEPLRGKVSKAWPEGSPKTDKETIATLVGKNKAQKEFLEIWSTLNKLSNALSKNLDFFLGVVEEFDCKFHANIRQATTGTHRLSGQGKPVTSSLFAKPKSMQTQNSPRIFKRLYCSLDPNQYFSSGDMSSLEFNVAVFLAQDEQGMKDVRDPDFDPHIQTATVMHDKDYDGTINQDLYFDLLRRYRAGDKEVAQWRTEAKPHTFKPLYGGEKGDEREERYYKWFFDHYSGLREAGELALAMVESGDEEGKGSFKTITGLEFRWNFYYRNGTAMDRSKHRPIKPAVYNYRVQYFATGEIVLIGLIHLYYRSKKKGLGVRLCNTVHDDVWAYVQKRDMEEYKKLFGHCFTHDVFRYLKKVYNIDFNVPLGIELTWGKHLGEFSYETTVDPVKEGYCDSKSIQRALG